MQVHDETPRSTWKLAVVEEVVKGNDGLVRSAKIRVGNKLTSRPITKLYPLEVKWKKWNIYKTCDWFHRLNVFIVLSMLQIKWCLYFVMRMYLIICINSIMVYCISRPPECWDFVTLAYNAPFVTWRSRTLSRRDVTPVIFCWYYALQVKVEPGFRSLYYLISQRVFRLHILVPWRKPWRNTTI